MLSAYAPLPAIAVERGVTYPPRLRWTIWHSIA